MYNPIIYFPGRERVRRNDESEFNLLLSADPIVGPANKPRSTPINFCSSYRSNKN